MNEHEDRLSAMKETIQKLPKPHFDNLRYLMKFLQHLSQFTTSNKMTPQNIAMAIAPSLIWGPNNSVSTPAIDMAATNLHSLIVYNLVESAQTLFPEGELHTVVYLSFTNYPSSLYLFYLPPDVNLTTLAQFSQNERFNGSTKSTCDQSNGDVSACTLQPPLRTKRIKKLAPKAPSSFVSSLRKLPSPSPRFERRSLLLRNNNDYEKLTNGSSCKQLDYSSSESTDQDVSGIAYRVSEFDTASLDRKILRSRPADRETVQARRNSNRRSVSNVQRPNVPPPEIPKSNSSLSKPRSSDDLLSNCHGRDLDESVGSLCLNTVDTVDSTGDTVNSTFNNTIDSACSSSIDYGQGFENSINKDLPTEPPKKPPRKSKSKSNHKSISVVEVTPPPEERVDDDLACQVQNSSSFDSKSEEISTEENPQQNILDESTSLKVASSSSSSLLCTEDAIDDEILTQDIPPPPMIPPPPPPPPSTPYDVTELENNSVVESTSLFESYSGSVDVKVKPPKPPPPPKPKAYQGNSVIEKSYL